MNKKTIKVRDLKPTKDAKGGGAHPAPQGRHHVPNNGKSPNKHGHSANN